jgi:hypothetical protein
VVPLAAQMKIIVPMAAVQILVVQQVTLVAVPTVVLQLTDHLLVNNRY